MSRGDINQEALLSRIWFLVVLESEREDSTYSRIVLDRLREKIEHHLLKIAEEKDNVMDDICACIL